MSVSKPGNLKISDTIEDLINKINKSILWEDTKTKKMQHNTITLTDDNKKTNKKLDNNCWDTDEPKH